MVRFSGGSDYNRIFYAVCVVESFRRSLGVSLVSVPVARLVKADNPALWGTDVAVSISVGNFTHDEIRQAGVSERLRVSA
jgi:hypothetical protein